MKATPDNLLGVCIQNLTWPHKSPVLRALLPLHKGCTELMGLNMVALKRVSGGTGKLQHMRNRWNSTTVRKPFFPIQQNKFLEYVVPELRRRALAWPPRLLGYRFHLSSFLSHICFRKTRCQRKSEGPATIYNLTNPLLTLTWPSSSHNLAKTLKRSKQLSAKQRNPWCFKHQERLDCTEFLEEISLIKYTDKNHFK